MPWYVLYTQSRKEKKITEGLQKNGIESYCPLVTVVKQWSDRKAKVQIPLISSYVFVNIEDSKRDEVFKVSGIVRYLFWLGKPAVVRDIEIQALKASLEGVITSFEIEEIKKDTHITLDKGPFKGAEGVVKHLNKNSIKLLLVDLGFLVTINR
jgi:transcriptional antiterminator RfaH